MPVTRNNPYQHFTPAGEAGASILTPSPSDRFIRCFFIPPPIAYGGQMIGHSVFLSKNLFDTFRSNVTAFKHVKNRLMMLDVYL
ncbi:hypothetical protein [Pseudomonas reactans]|uniref:hypothetical protein n=1 Tax=Pseudomonas reactans TaxID=117680 RepID=UPI0015A2C1D0|nr:hypothetical protein [Pseudomonas reactans]NWA68083.1 hypothetical protein [Pseudomonas reactans]